jgi:hypothetical protein
VNSCYLSVNIAAAGSDWLPRWGSRTAAFGVRFCGCGGPVILDRGPIVVLAPAGAVGGVHHRKAGGLGRHRRLADLIQGIDRLREGFLKRLP